MTKDFSARVGGLIFIVKKGFITDGASVPRFFWSLGIDMSTPARIAQALNEQTWIGVEADLDVDIDEYQGKFRNVVNKCKKSTMY